MTTFSFFINGQLFNLSSELGINTPSALAESFNEQLAGLNIPARFVGSPESAEPEEFGQFRLRHNGINTFAVYKRSQANDQQHDDLNTLINLSSGVYLDFWNNANSNLNASPPDSFNADGNINSQTEQTVNVPSQQGVELENELILALNKTIAGDSRVPAGYGAITSLSPMIVELTMPEDEEVAIFSEAPFLGIDRIHQSDIDETMHGELSGGVNVVDYGSQRLVFVTEPDMKYYFAALRGIWNTDSISVYSKRLNPLEISSSEVYPAGEESAFFTIGSQYSVAYDYESLAPIQLARYICFNPDGQKRYLVISQENIQEEVKALYYNNGLPPLDAIPDQLEKHEDGNYRFIIPAEM